MIDNADVNDSPLLVFPDAKYDAVERKNKKRLDFGVSSTEMIEAAYHPDMETRVQILSELAARKNRLSLKKKKN